MQRGLFWPNVAMQMLLKRIEKKNMKNMKNVENIEFGEFQDIYYENGY